MRERVLGEREVSSPACAPAQMPAIPSCTIDGAFGIARTTGTPGAMRASTCAVGIAAAMESTVCSGVSSGPTSASSASMSCGFTATTTSCAAARRGVRGRRLDAVPLAQLGRALLGPARDDDVGAARAEQADEQRLADAAAAEDGDHGC